MFSEEYKNRFLKDYLPGTSKSSKKENSSCRDRFIPCRANNNWKNNLALLPDPHDKVLQSTSPKHEGKKYETYVNLLKSELLGSNTTPNPNSPSADRNVGLFKYRPPVPQDFNIKCPYSFSPIGINSQKLLKSANINTNISQMPFKIFEAPGLTEGNFTNTLVWSIQNVLAVGLGSRVILWNAKLDQITNLCDFNSDNNIVTSLSWSPCGNQLAIGTYHGYVAIWDMNSRKQVNELPTYFSRISSLAWNNCSLTSGAEDGVILNRDTRTPPQNSERRLSGHCDEVCAMQWSPNNQYLASGGNDNRLNIWNQHSLAPEQSYKKHIGAVKSVEWSPQHHGILASGGGKNDGSIRLWNTITGQPIRAIDTGSQVYNLAWSKGSSELISTHAYKRNEILLWSYPSMTQLQKLSGNMYRGLYLAVSPDGQLIVTGAGDEKLRFWQFFNNPQKEQKNKIHAVEKKNSLKLFPCIR